MTRVELSKPNIKKLSKESPLGQLHAIPRLAAGWASQRVSGPTTATDARPTASGIGLTSRVACLIVGLKCITVLPSRFRSQTLPATGLWTVSVLNPALPQVRKGLSSALCTAFS